MTKLILCKTLEVRLPSRDVGISSYLHHLFRLGVLILLSLHFATTFLYSKGNLQSPRDVGNNKHRSNIKQQRPIGRLVFSSKNIYYVFVSVTALNLRSGPGVKNSVVRILPRGTHMLSLSSQNSDWLRVYAPHNFEGWVARKHVIFYHPKPFSTLYDKISSLNFRSLLEASILNYLKENYELKRLNINDKLSIIVEDLENGKIVVSILPDKSLKSASTIKLPILHAYMIQRSKGKLIENSNHKELIEKMIRFSSNSSTNTVIELLGGLAKIQKILEKTKIYKQIRLVEYIPENGRAYRNTISVADLNRIFRQLWFQSVIGPKYSGEQNRQVSIEMLNLLKLPGHPWLKDRIRAGTCYSINKTVKLWDKTGFVKGSNGNAGIVEINTPFGSKAYSLVLFIERKDFHSITGDSRIWFEQASMHMRRISEMTYAYFSKRNYNYNECGLTLLMRHTRNALFKTSLNQ